MDFYNNINNLEGKIPDMLSLRSRYMSGDKMEKAERRAAASILTTEQKEWVSQKSNDDKMREMDMTAETIIEGILN